MSVQPFRITNLVGGLGKIVWSLKLTIIGTFFLKGIISSLLEITGGLYSNKCAPKFKNSEIYSRNTSLAAWGAFTHCLQCRTTCKIHGGLTRFLGSANYFWLISFLFVQQFYEKHWQWRKIKRKKREKIGENSGPLTCCLKTAWTTLD